MIDHTDRFYIGQWFTFEDWEKHFQGLRLQLKVHLLPLKKITPFSEEFDVFETFIKAFSADFSSAQYFGWSWRLFQWEKNRFRDPNMRGETTQSK